MAGTGYHLELRFHRQLAGQGVSVFVGEHQPVVFAAVQQHRHMHIGQGLAAKHQAQGCHQQQRVYPGVGNGHQVITVGDQLPFCGAGITVFGALLAVAAQAIQVRLGACQDQRSFATCRITDHPYLVVMHIG